MRRLRSLLRLLLLLLAPVKAVLQSCTTAWKAVTCKGSDISGRYAAWCTNEACGKQRVVVVPTVLKGLNNQLMRIVSDIVGAMLIGAAVELPRSIATRRGCHFQVECYKDYRHFVPLWDIFDEAETLKALRQAGACIVPPQMGQTQMLHLGQQRMRTPIAASRLEQLGVNGSLVGASGQPVRRISFGKTCCVLFVPDSTRARRLFRLVNAAFRTAPALSGIARDTVSRFHAATGGPGAARTLALHWRAEGDMSQSKHALNVSDYARGVFEALATQRWESGPQSSGGRTHAILLGDVGEEQTRAIAAQLGASSWLTLHSKATLMPFRAKVPEALATSDDAVGMIDFEIGVQADAFIGSPFSSFSVRIALARAALSKSGASGGRRQQRMPTVMATGADTADRLGEILAVAYPYGAAAYADPCTALARIHPAWAIENTGMAACPSAQRRRCTRRSLLLQPEVCSGRFCGPADSTTDGTGGGIANRTADGTCPHVAPSFVFEPPLDHQLGCQLAVVTATFGELDMRMAGIGQFDAKARLKLATFEEEQGVTSCWFAVVDEAAFASLRTRHGNVPPAASGPPHAAASTSHQLVRWGLWNLVVLPRAMLPFEDARLNSRLPKMLLHRMFGSASYALYIDSKLHVNQSLPIAKLWPFVTRLLSEDQPRPRRPEPQRAFLRGHRGPAWISPKHKSRESIYEEAQCVTALGVVSKEVVGPQMDAYIAEGFPATPLEAGGPGLIDGEWHLRDLGSADQRRIGCAWLEEFVKRKHTRDQLSFNYVVWKLGLLPTQSGKRARFVNWNRGHKMFAKVRWQKRRGSKTEPLCRVNGTDIYHKASALVASLVASGTTMLEVLLRQQRDRRESARRRPHSTSSIHSFEEELREAESVH
jgi:hypothetical protein